MAKKKAVKKGAKDIKIEIAKSPKAKGKQK